VPNSNPCLFNAPVSSPQERRKRRMRRKENDLETTGLQRIPIEFSVENWLAHASEKYTQIG
jgi:hypothetical protein